MSRKTLKAVAIMCLLAASTIIPVLMVRAQQNPNTNRASGRGSPKDSAHTITKYSESNTRTVGHNGTTEFQASNVDLSNPPVFSYSPTDLLANQVSVVGATPDLSVLTGAPKPGASEPNNAGTIALTVTATFPNESTPTSQLFNLPVKKGEVVKNFNEIYPDGNHIVTYPNADLRQPDIANYTTADAQYASVTLGLVGFDSGAKVDVKLSWNGGYYTFTGVDAQNCVVQLSACEKIMPYLNSVNIFVFHCPDGTGMQSWTSTMR